MQSASKQTCLARTKRGVQCRCAVAPPASYCRHHSGRVGEAEEPVSQPTPSRASDGPRLAEAVGWQKLHAESGTFRYVLLRPTFVGHGTWPTQDDVVAACECSACLEFEALDESDRHWRSRNYLNRHCCYCSCRWCVCDARKGSEEYSTYTVTPYWDNLCWGGCPVCRDFRTDGGVSSVQVQTCATYDKVLEEAEAVLVQRERTARRHAGQPGAGIHAR